MKITKNPKFKHKQETDLMNLLMMSNFANLCVLLLTLGELFPKKFYKKSIGEWLENFVESSAMMREAEADDAQDKLLNDLMSECKGFTRADCAEIVLRLARLNPNQMKRQVLTDVLSVTCLTWNMQLALIQLHYDYGFGEIRTKRLVEALKKARYLDPIKQLHDRYKIEAVEECTHDDIMDLLPKKKKRNRVTDDDLTAIEDAKAFSNYMKQNGVIV